MADSILRLKVESQEYDAKIKRAAEGIQRYASECRKVGGTLEVVEKETLSFVQGLGRMETTSKTAKGSIGELTKAFTDLSVQYNKLTAAEKESPFGRALKSSLDEMKGRIQDSKKELDDINNSISGGGGLNGALDTLASKFGVSTNMLTKFGAGAAAATTALKVAKDAFFQSESNIDEWGRTLKGAESAYDVFLQTLNNGNWSNFFSNLETAIRGGRDLYDVFDRLGSIKANNAVAIATTQAEIQQLRLMKQQGQDVDDRLKAATQRLKVLQSQSAEAGINAGRSQVVNTLRNGVNSTGGARINEATLNRVADNISKQGQAYFDFMKRRAANLEKQGMVTHKQTITDSQGGTYERQYKVFDINALSQEQQKQYAIAKVVTERETEIQKGLTAWSQAVNEQTANTREIFRDNRYALQGSGGGKGSKTPKATKSTDDVIRDQWANAQNHITASMNDISALPDLGGASAAWEAYAQSVEASTNDVKAPLVEMQEELQRLIELQQLAANPEAWADYQKQIEGVNNKIKKFKGEGEEVAEDGKEGSKSWSAAANAIGSVGSALSQIDDPAAKIMGIIAQAVANVALGYSQALTMVKEVGGPWGWIAFAATGLATMVSTISAIHSATGYAEGGMVDGRGGGMIAGNTYSTDSIPIMANAGEVILNRAQSANIAGQLQGSGGGTVNVRGRVVGTDLLLVVDNTLRKTGRGELLTWK